MDGKLVLLVDGDGPLRRMLAEQLAGLAPDHEVALADAAAEATALLPACAVLVVAGGGAVPALAELVRAVRADGRGALALADDPAQAAMLEDAGATVLAKPVRLADLARAVRAALRPGIAQPLAMGALRLDPTTRELAAATGGAGGRVRLTEKEAAILAYLIRAGGRTVPREELLAEVWGYDAAVTTHTLETHVYRLRRKIAAGGAGADGPRLIGEASGYRLSASDPASASTAR